MTTIKGWVTTTRFGKRVGFIHITDGIKSGTTQVVVKKELIEEIKGRVGIGTSLIVSGEMVESTGSEQALEMQAESIQVVGECDASKYPIQKKDVTLEHLRTMPHLRVKTQTFQSVFRVRSVISHAIHDYFKSKDFMWVHTPIITASDCEGAGEMFSVSAGKEDFFDKKVGLTVSGQLEVEPFVQAFSKVYTFGPTFRAEDSNTSRHASEFWMVEPEIAFADLDDVIDLAEDFIKSIALSVLIHAKEDVEYLRGQQGLDMKDLWTLAKPSSMGDVKSFDRVTHDEAQDILMASGREFEFPIGRGEALQAEHEKYLCEHFAGPVFVTDYPRMQKSFYMKVSEDRKTVRATDLLVPGVGEIIGGSQREEDLDTLVREMLERGMDPEELDWYLDLRRYGSVPHGGFGLGLERIIMWITGVQNIRDVIPYPRTPGKVY
jgi:asparaginyl-tRNA synthetase